MIMIDSEDKLFTSQQDVTLLNIKAQKRLQALSNLGLQNAEMIPVFEEATQTAAHCLESEICILGFMDDEKHWFKSAVGLSRLGLMNELAKNRQLLRQESFCHYVVDSLQPLVINDVSKITNYDIKNSKLVQSYGIRAYLGAPMIDADGNCLGTLAVMDRQVRNFTNRDVELLQIIARWSMSEFERNLLITGNRQIENTITNTIASNVPEEYKSEERKINLKITTSNLESDIDLTKQIKFKLLSQLTEELRTPLTSVLGMASVLGREIYGPLTSKQREYLEIIQHSGKYLLSIVNQITELAVTNENSCGINLVAVDIEMLCKQVIHTLEDLANRRQQNIRLSIEPGQNRFLSLDKDKVRQIIYNLLFSVIQLSVTGSIIRVHISYKTDTLGITVWVSHPWLGDSITEVDSYFYLNSWQIVNVVKESKSHIQGEDHEQMKGGNDITNLSDSQSNLLGDDLREDLGDLSCNISREKLGLLLSCHLAELHGGEIAIQGSSESGYRYVVSLPLKFATSSTQ